MGVPDTEDLAHLRVFVAIAADGLGSLAEEIDDRLHGLAEESTAMVQVETTDLTGRLSDLATGLHRELGRSKLDRDHAVWLVVAGARLLSAAETMAGELDRLAGPAVSDSASISASNAVGDAIERCKAAFDEVARFTTYSNGDNGATTTDETEAQTPEQRLLSALVAVRQAFLEETEEDRSTVPEIGASATSGRPVGQTTFDDTIPARFFAGVVGEALSLIASDTGQAVGLVRLVSSTSDADGNNYVYAVEISGETRTLVATQRHVPLVSPITLVGGGAENGSGSGLLLRDAEGIEAGVNEAANG